MSPRSIVEQVKCDRCAGITTRALVPTGTGGRAEQEPLPDGWIAVIRRWSEQHHSGAGVIHWKVDNIYCSAACAITALADPPAGGKRV